MSIHSNSRKFVQDVTDTRRRDDSDPDKAIVSDTMKVIGHSASGTTIMDQEKINTVEYIQDDHKVTLKINRPQFQKLEIYSEIVIEVIEAKATLTLNLQI